MVRKEELRVGMRVRLRSRTPGWPGTLGTVESITAEEPGASISFDQPVLRGFSLSEVEIVDE